MASLLEPISNTKVHDHSPQKRSSLKDISTDAISYDSYGDIWGESSFRSIVDEGKPKVIDETAEQRWSAEIKTLNSATFGVNIDEDLEETNNVSVGAGTGAGAGVSDYSDPESSPTVPIIAKLNDGGDNSTTTTNTKQKRRGSNDMVPIRPNRRYSVKSTIVGKGELAEIITYKDLSRRGNSIELDAETVNEEDCEEA